MPLSKFISLLKGVYKKICNWWKKAPHLLNPEQINPEQINPEQINPEQINSETNNPKQVNPEQADSEQSRPEQNNFKQLNLEQVNPKKKHDSLVECVLESLENKNQQDIPTISQEKIMINISTLQNTLQNFVSSTPGVQGVALVSPDGLSLASVLPTQMDEERTAAMSASILSLGERIGGELARGNVERIVVRGEKGYSILVGCGSEAVLLVLANATAKKGLLFLESKRVVNEIIKLIG